jgi:hypothetical protein
MMFLNEPETIVKTWTPKDDATLREWWGNAAPEVIAMKIGRKGSNSIRQRARKLGLVDEVEKTGVTISEKGNLLPDEPLSKEKRIHMGRVAIMPCAVSGEDCQGRIERHHIRRGNEGKDDARIIPLCQFHHRDQVYGYHGMSREGFDERYNIEARKLATVLWRETLATLNGKG